MEGLLERLWRVYGSVCGGFMKGFMKSLWRVCRGFIESLSGIYGQFKGSLMKRL